MKIALVGAPGAGKSDLAEALAMEFYGDTAIVDNYVPRLEKQTDTVFGHFADFTDNLMVTFERLAAERAAEASGATHQITCGTLIETVLYTQLYARATLKIAKDEDLAEEIARAENAARISAQLVWDQWRYDYVFVLPLTDEKREPGGWDTLIDDDLMRGLEAFFIRYEVLKSNATPEERVAQVIRVIERDKVNQSDPSIDEPSTSE